MLKKNVSLLTENSIFVKDTFMCNSGMWNYIIFTQR